MKYDLEFFKANSEIIFKEFTVQYDFFKKGDFGDLNRISFENDILVGEIIFWSSGVLSAGIFSYQLDESLFDILCWAEEKEKQEELIERVFAVIQSNLERFSQQLLSCLQGASKTGHFSIRLIFFSN